MTPRNREYAKYDPPGAQISDDALAQKYLLYTPSSRRKRKIWVRKAGIHGRIFSIPAAEFAQDVLAHTLQDGPIDLLCPDFNLTSAKMDSTNIKAEISSKIIRLATPSVLDSLFNQLCPGYSKEPHTALNHVRQIYNDANGNKVFSSVYNYYTQILAVSCPFIDMETLPVSVCQAFIDGIDQRLSAGFRTHFPNYSIPQD